MLPPSAAIGRCVTMTGLRPPLPMLLADAFDAASTFRRLRAPTPARRDIAQSADTALPWNVVGVGRTTNAETGPFTLKANSRQDGLARRFARVGLPRAPCPGSAAVRCSGLARVDLFLEKPTGKFFVNEINTLPGFTSISMYPKLWEASGLSYADLLDRLIALAIERHAEKKKLRTKV